MLDAPADLAGPVRSGDRCASPPASDSEVFADENRDELADDDPIENVDLSTLFGPPNLDEGFDADEP